MEPEFVEVPLYTLSSYRRPDDCFLVGKTDEPTVDNSIFICIKPNKFRYADSNINIGNFMEGNSETNRILFYGPLEADEGFVIPETLHLTKIEKCDSCGFDLQKNLTEFNEEQQINKKWWNEVQQYVDEPIVQEPVKKPTGVPGIIWGGDGLVCSLCFDCMRDVAIAHRARQNWLDKNGDPVQKLQHQVHDLTQMVMELQSKIQSLEKTQYVVKRVQSDNDDYHGNNY